MRKTLQRLTKRFGVRLQENSCGAKPPKIPSEGAPMVIVCSYDYIDGGVRHAHIFGYYYDNGRTIFVDSGGVSELAYNTRPFDGAPNQLPDKENYPKWDYPEPDEYLYTTVIQGNYCTCAAWFIFGVHLLMVGTSVRDIQDMFCERTVEFLHPIVLEYVRDYRMSLRNYNGHPNWDIAMCEEAGDVYARVIVALSPPKPMGRPKNSRSKKKRR